MEIIQIIAITLLIIFAVGVVVLIVSTFHKIDRETKEGRKRHNQIKSTHVFGQERNDYYLLNDQEKHGVRGENAVEYMLEMFIDDYHCMIFHNLTIKDFKGNTTEIDHIFVCRGGVFVIETKSHKGEIYGNINDDQWYQQRPYPYESKSFKNPVIQNENHIKFLKRMFSNNPPAMKSLIIFPCADRICTDYDYVLSLRDAHDYLLDMIKTNKYSDEYVDRIGKQLKEIQDKYGVSSLEHKKHINERYH